MAIKSARDFYLAINEATRVKGVDDPSTDAIEYLELMSENVFKSLDIAGAQGRKRDNIIFWEGMLKGVQLRLAKDRLKDQQATAENNRIFHTPEPGH